MPKLDRFLEVPLSFGATAWARNKLGIDGGVDNCTRMYGVGEAAGFFVGFIDG